MGPSQGSLATSTFTPVPTPTDTSTETPTFTPTLVPTPTASNPVLVIKNSNKLAAPLVSGGVPSCLNDGVVANNYNVALSGALLIDSYDSSLGAYGSNNHSSQAVVQAGLEIQNSDGCTIKGTQIQNTLAGFTPVPTPSGATNLGNYSVASGASVTLSAGNYIASSLTVNSGAKLTANGQVYLWVDGTMDLEGQVLTVGGKPENFWLLGTSNCVQILNQSDTNIYAIIDAPTAQISLSGGDNNQNTLYYGSMIGSSINLSGKIQVHVDTELYCKTATPTATVTKTFTITPTPSPTPVKTNTFTPTITPTETKTLTNTATKTSTYTDTATLTNTVSNTATKTSTNTSTNSASATASSTVSNTASATATKTGTNTATITVSNTATTTSTSTATNSFTSTPTNTFTNTPTNTSSNTVTNTTTATFTPTATSTSTNTSTASFTETATNSATNTLTNTATYTFTNTPTSSATSTSSNTVTNTMTNTNTDTFTNTDTNTTTNTFTDTPTNSATSTATNTATSTSTGTFTDTATNTYTSTFTNTFTNTDTNTPTNTDTTTFTLTWTSTATSTLTQTPTSSPSPSPTNACVASFKTIAGSSVLGSSGLVGVALDASDNLYVSDNDVKVLSPSGALSSDIGPQTLVDPQGLAVDNSAQEIYVVDATLGQVYVFGFNGTLKRNFNSLPGGGGTLLTPLGITLDGNGHVWVTDGDLNEAVEYTTSGTALTTVGNGTLSFPEGVAVDSNGHIFVGDGNNYRIVEFNNSGTQLNAFTGGGIVSDPYAMQFDGSGNLWVADDGSNMIEEFSDSGVLENLYNGSNQGSLGFQLPLGVAVDASGNIFAAENGSQTLVEITTCGTVTPTVTAGVTACETLVFQWGGNLNNPIGLAYDKAGGTVYLAEYSSDQIAEFTTLGAFVRQWGSAGSGNGQFDKPFDMVLGPNGYLYVLENNGGNHRVQAFDKLGNYLFQFNGKGINNAGPSVFTDAISFALDGSGNLYVLDSVLNRVSVFDPNGNYLRGFTETTGNGNTQWNAPQGIAVDASGFIYVADTNNFRITVFDPNGNYQRKFGTPGNGPGQFSSIFRIKFDPLGRLWIENDNDREVDIYDKYGKFISTFSTDGGNGNIVHRMLGWAFGPSGDVWVADFDQNLVDHFDSCLQAPTFTPTPTPLNLAQSCFLYLGQFGSTGNQVDQFENPLGIASDANGNIYVSDFSNDRIEVFDPNGNYLRTWGSAGNGVGQFNNPQGVAVDTVAGHVYVTDTNNNRVQEFDLLGNPITQWGSAGVGNGQFASPTGIAVNKLGSVFVSDYSNGRVQQFSTLGVFEGFVTTVGSFNGQVTTPSGLAVDTNNNLYVVDASSSHVYKFDSSNNFLAQWGSQGSGNGQLSNAWGIAVGQQGFVYVADRNNNRVEVFDTNGTFLKILGSSGTGPGQFNQPIGMAVGPSGRIYATDFGNNRVEIFIPCPQITPTPVGPQLVGKPDLSINQVDVSKVITNNQSLQISGTVSAAVTNQGNAQAEGPFETVFFEDTVGDGLYHPGTSNLLGTVGYAGTLAAGSSVTLSAPVTGTVLFSGNIIYAFVDSLNQVAESNENNNYYNSGFVCSYHPPAQSFEARLKWSWTTSSVMPAYNNVSMVPLVADLNKTGIPNVIFTSYEANNYSGGQQGLLRILNGNDGSEVLTVTDPSLALSPLAQLAVGDLDGNGKISIVGLATGARQLIAFNADGTQKWVSAPVEVDPGDSVYSGGPALADIDGNGVPEIILGRQVFNHDGTLRWTGVGSGPVGGPPYGKVSLVADINMTGSPLIVAGNTVYRNDGSILWKRSDLPDGSNAVARFNPADPYPDIDLVSSGNVWLLDHLGNTVWGPVALPGGGFGGPPCVADVDGNGIPSIGVVSAIRYTVIGPTGLIRWSMPTREDGVSNAMASSAFDFDGSGKADFLYRDTVALRVFNGATGTVMFQTALSSCTAYEYPLVADIDGSGHSSIVCPSNNSCGFGPNAGVFTYQSPGSGWPESRKIWNQYDYHITNVNDDGSIPVQEAYSWNSFNN